MTEYTDILDHGFIRLVDFMGGDLAVVQAARVSLGKGITNTVRDKKLVDFLMANHHETPFEHSVFKFHIKCPIFVARQWFRHRMASYNEISGRYTEMEEQIYLPERLRTQKAQNYQYQLLEEEKNRDFLQKIGQLYQEAFTLYQELLENGVAKEHARIILPAALYTQFYWTINARSLMNFLVLRLDIHAQEEIRLYAKVISRTFRQKMPWTYEAFDRYLLNNDDKP